MHQIIAGAALLAALVTAAPAAAAPESERLGASRPSHHVAVQVAFRHCHRC